ncbi:hypothetical protein Salat_2976300 [Sesamum alatum]|uniref:Uncharacterized protein n=1 Tax=Sesamum alatum TaxID=300844 RepID=A0AAE1XIJ8_9LAMI|nr:hypothetical protein Salat_2976300 [Sesamum alatum]
MGTAPPAARVSDPKGIENERRICVHYLWSGVTILNLLFPISPFLPSAITGWQRLPKIGFVENNQVAFIQSNLLCLITLLERKRMQGRTLSFPLIESKAYQRIKVEIRARAQRGGEKILIESSTVLNSEKDFSKCDQIDRESHHLLEKKPRKEEESLRQELGKQEGEARKGEARGSPSLGRLCPGSGNLSLASFWSARISLCFITGLAVHTPKAFSELLKLSREYQMLTVTKRLSVDAEPTIQSNSITSIRLQKPSPTLIGIALQANRAESLPLSFLLESRACCSRSGENLAAYLLYPRVLARLGSFFEPCFSLPPIPVSYRPKQAYGV